MYTVDLNSDLGESFGNYKIGNDDKIIPLISSANVACGYHASDPVVMGNTLAMAKEAGIRIGAHPGFPDLMGFGRRNLSVSPAEAKAYVLYQLGALDAFCRVTGVKMQHVKQSQNLTAVCSHLLFPADSWQRLLRIWACVQLWRFLQTAPMKKMVLW